MTPAERQAATLAAMRGARACERCARGNGRHLSQTHAALNAASCDACGMAVAMAVVEHIAEQLPVVAAEALARLAAPSCPLRAQSVVVRVEGGE